MDLFSSQWHGSARLHGCSLVQRCSFCWRLVWLISSSDWHIAHCNLHIENCARAYTKKCASHDNFVFFSCGRTMLFFELNIFYINEFCIFPLFTPFLSEKQLYWALDSRWYYVLPSINLQNMLWDRIMKFKSYSIWLYAHGVNDKYLELTLWELSRKPCRWTAICIDNFPNLNIYANQFLRNCMGHFIQNQHLDKQCQSLAKNHGLWC